MDEKTYCRRLEELFTRYPSVQNVGFGGAYKPGLEHMRMFCGRLGNPHCAYRTIHVAGTNGKGSVANMISSAIASKGPKVGLYTSPHILDFRERMRIIGGGTETAELISKEDVWEFITTYEKDFDELSLSFFEITTGMAFWWFKKQGVDYAVMEVGLGGRLDSTNVITPELSIITSIGLDHCAMLGDTRTAIAGEKGGIIKPGVPAVIGSRDPETAPVFEAIAGTTGSTLIFADGSEPYGCARISADQLDLKGDYQSENLRTVLTSLETLGIEADSLVLDAIRNTASRMAFHGRWDMISHNPDMICDIGHNPPALEKNFAQLDSCLDSGEYSDIIIVYGVMADKDLDGILPLMPKRASYIFVAPDTARAMKVETLYSRCLGWWAANVKDCKSLSMADSVAEGLKQAVRKAERKKKALIYVGGSTFVVSEAIGLVESRQ